MAVRVTSIAGEQLLKRSKNIFFYCKSGGCNGFEYVLSECDDKPTDTETQRLDSGLLLHVCNISMFHLLGTEIDWCEDIMGARFIFDNPNASSACGCGLTFST
jgi:iron-sulfur cluster assembly accessory protein